MPPAPSEAPPPPYGPARGEGKQTAHVTVRRRLLTCSPGVRSHAYERAAVRESREARRSSFATWVLHGLSIIDNDFNDRDAAFRAEFGNCLDSLLDDMQR